MKRFLLLSILLFISFLSCANNQPPPADDVFKLTANRIDPNSFILEWTIAPGFFLYRDRIHFTEIPNEPFHLANINFPNAIKKHASQNQIIKIYRNKLTMPVSVLGSQGGEGLFNINFQGCSNDGFCYPPEMKQVKLAFNDKRELIDASIEQKQMKSPSQTEISPNNDSLHQLFSTNNWAWIFLSFFGFGLLLSFTPCVLPMIPVLSSIILGQGKKLSVHKSFLLSLSYILSMATTYAFVGAFVALMGSNLQIAIQTPWVIAVFSIIFVLLALSMFEFYDLRLPSSWQTKLTKLSHSRAGGYYIGAAIMGCLSTLILSPCVTAPLIGALGYIANTGDVARGSLSLFFMGLGMGTPLLLIGSSASKWIPKTGNWMHAIKAFFGLLLLAVAINLLSRILPAVFIMGLWASLLIFTGIYSGALTHARTNQEKFRQGIGIITLIYGILILIGASQGSQDPLQPLIPPVSSRAPITSHTPLKTLSAVKQAIADANKKPIILDFYADWCASCKHIEATTLKDPAVVQALQNVVFIKIDVTNNNEESQALLNYFNVIAPPTFIFYNSNSKELSHLRLVGNLSTKQLLNSLGQILN